MLLLTAVLLAQNSHAQDYNRWSLPDGALMRLGKGDVRDVVWSPDGTRLAVGTSPGIWLYDARTGAQIYLITGHSFRVNAVAFSPDGLTLASGSRDHTVRLWDVATGQEKSILTGHTNDVEAVAFSQDGTTLASAGSDSTVRVWDVATGQEQHTLTGHVGKVGSVVFSPDGLTLASAGSDSTVRVWDVATGQEQHTLTGHVGLSSIRWSFSPDGSDAGKRRKRLYGADVGCGHRAGKKHTHRTWDYRRGVFAGWIRWVRFHQMGRRWLFASAGGDGTVRVWDVDTGQLIRTHKADNEIFWSVAFSPDGATLATGSHFNAGAVVGRGHRARNTHPHRTYRTRSGRWCFLRMGKRWRAAVTTVRYCCGMCRLMSHLQRLPQTSTATGPSVFPTFCGSRRSSDRAGATPGLTRGST